ncbi:hypothetical protein WJX73_005984 [Symbiochloris irregularis]|uniref:Rhodanese domain-containing protein n=1 Tax=Symbiochloris irregularis TaxID=706552 RepID=A0AAW1PDY9_9CHLO
MAVGAVLSPDQRSVRCLARAVDAPKPFAKPRSRARRGTPGRSTLRVAAFIPSLSLRPALAKASADVQPGNGQAGGQDALQSAGSSLSQASSGLNETTGGRLQDAQDALQSALSGANAQVSGATQQVVNAVPPEVRQALQSVAGPTQQALVKILSNGYVAAVVFGLPLFLVWRATRGGFSGYLSPKATLELLNKRNAILVDLRPSERREREGIPELRFGARGKGAALSIPSVPRAISKQVRNAGDLPYLVAAVEIQGLKQVSDGCNFVILEDRKRDGLRLARALQSQVQARSYVLQGGFRAWQAAGLPVKSVVDYEWSFSDAISDEAENIVRNTKAVAAYLADPLNIALTGILAAGAVNTVRDWHNTLQVIGVYGPAVSTGLWLRQFDSAEAAVEAVQQRRGRGAKS